MDDADIATTDVFSAHDRHEVKTLLVFLNIILSYSNGLLS